MAGAERDAGSTPTLSVEGRIATIALQRPAQANRLELEDLHVLRAQVATVNSRAEVLVLRFVAEGPTFCAGFNLHAMRDQAAIAGALFEQLADEIASARAVTIAALQGGIYGGATDLAIACDFRIGVRGCELRVPAARLGLHYYRGGLERYVTLLGPSLTKRVMLLAETFDAEAMLASGILDRLLPTREALASELQDMSVRLADSAPLSLIPMKRHINGIAQGRLDAEAIARDIARATASEDLKEGSRAWQERRQPKFRGC